MTERSELYELHERPPFASPIMVIALEGFVDAGFAAAAAAQALATELHPTPVATFDTDALIDYRARRPVARIREGVVSELVWPSIDLSAATDLEGNELLLLTGHEPDALWRRFSRELVDLAIDFGCRMVFNLGAFPAEVPHTRAPLLVVTAGTDSLAAQSGWQRPSIDAATSIGGVLEHECSTRELPAVGIWAQVPHYVSAMPYPAAAAALLAGLAQMGGIKVRAEALQEAATTQRERIDMLVSQNAEHQAMVRALEQQYDASSPRSFSPSELPSGDELAAELERFLRNQ